MRWKPNTSLAHWMVAKRKWGISESNLLVCSEVAVNIQRKALSRFPPSFTYLPNTLLTYIHCQYRLRPEDITINIGKGVPIPVPNMPGKWKQVIHDQTVTWLANWTENINGNHKYVFLAAGSSLKGQSDMNKFEKARELKVNLLPPRSSQADRGLVETCRPYSKGLRS